MNIGQLLEVHLGWAAKGIGKKIDDMVQQQKSVAELRKYLDKVYNKTGGKSDVNLDELNDAEIVNLAKNLTGGLPVSSPVFDGAAEEELKDLLELAGLPRHGPDQLTGGRTGHRFSPTLPVRNLYNLNLNKTKRITI